nr:hypothetical protein [Mesorhizobium waimense]
MDRLQLELDRDLHKLAPAIIADRVSQFAVGTIWQDPDDIHERSDRLVFRVIDAMKFGPFFVRELKAAVRQVEEIPRHPLKYRTAVSVPLAATKRPLDPDRLTSQARTTGARWRGPADVLRTSRLRSQAAASKA